MPGAGGPLRRPHDRPQQPRGAPPDRLRAAQPGGGGPRPHPGGGGRAPDPGGRGAAGCRPRPGPLPPRRPRGEPGGGGREAGRPRRGGRPVPAPAWAGPDRRGAASSAVRPAGRERGALGRERGRLEQYVPGDARLGFRLAGDDVRLERIEVPFAAGGTVTGQGTVKLDRQASIEADVKVEGGELADLLERLGLVDAHVMMRLGAHIKLAGTARPFRLAGDVAREARDFRVLDHPWKGYHPGEPAVLDLDRARVESPVRVDAEGVDLLGATVSAGAGSMRAEGRLHFRDAGGFQLALQGTADLSELRHVAAVPLAGRAEGSGTVRE